MINWGEILIMFKDIIKFYKIGKDLGLSRKEICERLFIPRTTIYDNLFKLMNKKINYYSISSKLPYSR